jgi:hypothetical protein
MRISRMTRLLLAIALGAFGFGCGEPANDATPPVSDGFRDPLTPPPDDLCGDGLDNDVDGEVDEGCYCEGAESQACFPGNPEELDVGLCRAGVQTCVGARGDFDLGEWGACIGAIVATPEICGNAVDEDCDGYASPCQDGDVTGTPCHAGESTACYPGPTGTEDVGLCGRGVRSCGESDVWGPCEGAVTPQEEVCDNGLDEDCDGDDVPCDDAVN